MSSCYVCISCLLEWKFKRQIHHDMNVAEASRPLLCKGPSTSFCIHNFVLSKRIQKIVSSGHPNPGSTPMEMTSPEDLLVEWCGILGDFQVIISGLKLRPPCARSPSTCASGCGPSPTPWDPLALVSPVPRWPSSQGKATAPSSAICLGPALLQLCPLGSWGRASPSQMI